MQCRLKSCEQTLYHVQPQWIHTKKGLCFVLSWHVRVVTLTPVVFPERVQCRLHPKGADWGERLQHVRVRRVEEQEAADVRGPECPREATAREENPQEEHCHPLPANYGVSWEAQMEKEDMQHWTPRFSILTIQSCRIKTFVERSETRH